MKETTDGDYDSGEIEYLDDGGISVPLIEEELVVLKRKVVRERVVVRKNAQTETIAVEAHLRKERIETDGGTDAADNTGDVTA